MEKKDDQAARMQKISELIRTHKAFLGKTDRRSLNHRLELLGNLETTLISNREEISAALAKDLGKPEMESFLAEYLFTLQELRLIKKRLKKWLKPQKARGPFYFLPFQNRITREPFGTVLIIAPWNYPIQLSLAPLIAAIAAGNTVILKPSEMAPACATILEKILTQVFEPGHVDVICGGAEISQELLAQPLDFVFFTGSTEIGRKVAAQAAKILAPTVLELGGKCPCVVDSTADIQTTAKRILIGKLFNSGQTCFAPDFIAVDESIKTELTNALAKLLRDLPWEREMSQIINAKHFHRIQALLQGPEIKKGIDDEARQHLAPRILPEAKWSDPAMQEEIFGPVLPIVSYSSLEDLKSKLPNYADPLALYIFSKETSFIKAITTTLRSGSVCINDTMKQATTLHMPFGGVGTSGHGRYRGKASIETFTYQRSTTKRFFLPDLFESLPPRAKQTKLLKRWMK